MKRIAILFILALVACGWGCTKQGVTNLHSMVYGEPTMGMVSNCIAAGAQKAGWQLERLDNDRFMATYYVKDKLGYDEKAAFAEITYSTTSYRIEHSRTVELLYNEQKNTVHKNYNKWIRELDAAIQRELSKMALDERGKSGVYSNNAYD